MNSRLNIYGLSIQMDTVWSTCNNSDRACWYHIQDIAYKENGQSRKGLK